MPKHYSPELKAFALTLHFYSPKAYNFVRKTFNSALPHTSSIQKWYQNIDASPGFSTEAFKALSYKINNSAKKLFFSLLFDEMAIRQHVEFDGRRFHGYVETGNNIDDDSIPLAKDALVFMIVCINDNWKIPVGYFLINVVNSNQKANLVRQCLSLLHEENIHVISVTCDGLSSNINMFKNLGCTLQSPNINPIFKHPLSNYDIVAFLDPCHMLKLIRNTFGEKKLLLDDDDDRLIDWKYVAALHNLQEQEGLNLANKLKGAHINFFKQKMKVRLASQLFSKSVADAITFCDSYLNLQDFKGSEATVKFITVINDIFDILNSRSERQFGLKKPICKENFEEVGNILENIQNYIERLNFGHTEERVIASTRKTGFLGFIICIKSLKILFDKYLKETTDLNSLPVYKLSQDHLETFFEMIRMQGGCNNNPTARQFKAAYKKLLIHSELPSYSKGNCIPLEDIHILGVKSISAEKIINFTSTGYCSDLNVQVPVDHDYLFDAGALSECSRHIIYYIAGYIVRKLSFTLKCEICVDALEANIPVYRHSLVSVKSNGMLIHPSENVFYICKQAESIFRRNVNLNESQLYHKNNFLKVKSDILFSLKDKDIFKALYNHMHDTHPLQNHVVLLMQSIIEHYLRLRYLYWGKSRVTSEYSVRQLYNKLILFKGQ